MACNALGVSRVEWLPYRDSGMSGAPTTEHPDAFSNALLDEATQHIAELLDGETIKAVVGYDHNGTYGHPDHVQVHRLAHHAARALGAGWVLDARYSREELHSAERLRSRPTPGRGSVSRGSGVAAVVAETAW